MKPLLFLDVDGVLNVFDAPHLYWGQLYTDSLTIRQHGRPWRQVEVTMDRDHPRLLQQLENFFELVWATAWEDNANGKLRTLLRLQELPVVRFTDMPVVGIGQGLHWKTERLIGWAAGRPFCWIDDEPTSRDQEHLDAAGVNALIVTTEPVDGLQQRHVQAALQFAARLRGEGCAVEESAVAG